jgi:hypothetical protein
MLYNVPYYPIPTGYQNATGWLTFNITGFNNFDYIVINDNKIYYYPDLTEFNGTEFFNSTGTFIENINNNSDTYQVSLSLNNNKFIIKSLISGDGGNNITLNSNNNNVFFSNSTLEGGKNIYSILQKPQYPLNRKNLNLVSPIFSGNYSNKFYVTGFYYSLASTAFLEGNINSYVGLRNFQDIWNISTGFVTKKDLVNFKANNYFNGYYYSHNAELGRSRIPIKIQINYNNILAVQSDNIDVGELVIRDLNAPTASRLSGIIFRITGVG